jgi:uncharacterized membrane protein (UPF0127 family)
VVNGATIPVEIADTPDERQRGLMFRESLPKDRGMLFIFDEEGTYSFWMKNTMIHLDIIWISSENIVVHVEKDLTPCLGLCPSYKSNQPARYVLEVNSGVADELGIHEGTTVGIPSTAG